MGNGNILKTCWDSTRGLMGDPGIILEKYSMKKSELWSSDWLL
jgi:hypothetical protein